MVLVVFQLLPLDAHGHWPQLLVHTEVIGMLCEGRAGRFSRLSEKERPGHSGSMMR
jgi:hypothetical protein